MEHPSVPSFPPVWPCAIETTASVDLVRDGRGQATKLPEFQDACRQRAALLQRQARDAALDAVGAWILLLVTAPSRVFATPRMKAWQ